MRYLSALIAAAAAADVGRRAPRQARQSATADVQVQLGDLFFAEGRYAEARDAYRRAIGAADDPARGAAAPDSCSPCSATADFRARFRGRL